jgi:tetratricopeptide (TPR) repeat protein
VVAGRACEEAPYDCAVALIQKGQRDEAIRILEHLVGAAPRDLRTLNLLGIALTGAGRVDAGAERFRQALAVDPEFVPARKNLGVAEFNRGRLAEAGPHLEAVLQRTPDDDVAHLYLAEIHFRARDLDAALRHYEKAGARVAQNREWARNQATARFEAGVQLGKARRYAEAARLFERARPDYADPYAAAYNQVLMLVEAADHTAAIRLGEDLLAAGTVPAELHSLLARAYQGAGEVQKAYDALRTAARLQPEAEDHYVDLSALALEHHNYDLGLEIVDIGLGRLPSSWLLRLQRGVLLASKGELKAAEAEFEAAAARAPDQPGPYAALAMAWMQAGHAPKAVERLRVPVRAGRAHPIVLYTFAVAVMRSGVDPAAGEAEEAVDALRAAVRQKPDLTAARAELGRILLRRGDLAAAVVELEKAVTDDPTSSAALYNLSQAYMKKGDRARAAELAARVSRLNARERGEGDADLRRAVFRLVREGAR